MKVLPLTKTDGTIKIEDLKYGSPFRFTGQSVDKIYILTDQYSHVGLGYIDSESGQMLFCARTCHVIPVYGYFKETTQNEETV